MEIRRLRAFRAIVECGGLTKAAALLHVTPGALSKAMRRLERETGKALLVKRGRGLRLTEHGKLLYHASGPLIEAHAQVLRKLDASEGAGLPTLRLATYEVFSTHFLGALLQTGLAERSCQINELPVGELERAISDHESDIGITYVPVPRPGLAFRPIGEISFHAHVRRGAFTDVPFSEIPFAIPSARIDAALADVLGIDCWPYERVPRLVKYRLGSLESALELCRNGLCAVFLPAFLAGLHNAGRQSASQIVRLRPPPELGAVTRRVHVVHRDEEAGEIAIETVVTAARDALERATLLAEA